MMNNRRIWLKQAGLVIMGSVFGQLKALASPIPGYFNSNPGDIPIHLGLNENPYGPSPLARIAILENIANSNRYNWGRMSELISAIAKKNNINPSNILMGAGATEILNLVFRFTALKKGNFILTKPTYSNWSKPAQTLGYSKIEVPLTKDKRHDLTAMLKAIKPDTKLIYICNPNNPTGTICERDTIISFLKEATKKVILLIDEAYIDYTNQQSLCDFAIENKNLIVVKTFSKIYGLAGGRIGYAVANTSTINALSQLQSWPPQSISVVSVAGALASLKDEEFIKETYSLNEKARKYTIEQLERLNIRCIPSHTNFIYFSLSNYKKDFFEQLENNNIIGTEIYEDQGKWSRITIGTIQEMEMFISALE